MNEGPLETDTTRSEMEALTLTLVEVATLTGHERSVSSLKFSPDGKFLASACIYIFTHNNHTSIYSCRYDRPYLGCDQPRLHLYSTRP